MPNTTNFNWTTPADTDLVKDGALAIRTLANGIDTSLVDLKGGTTGQVLSKATNTDLDFTWVAQDDSNAIQNAIIDAKGDLIVGTAADTPARLAVGGTNDHVLTIDSSTSTGLKWAAPASVSGPAFSAHNNTTQSISQNVATKVSFQTELFDTDSCFASSTFTPNKSGYYLVTASIIFDPFALQTYCWAYFYKNGSVYNQWCVNSSTDSGNTYGGSTLIYMNGTTDTLEVYAKMSAATARDIPADNKGTMFSAVWIRS